MSSEESVSDSHRRPIVIPFLYTDSELVIITPHKKLPPRQKLTTKIMIQKALEDLKSQKGVSLYAIKKYIKERYNVDTEKRNNLIKKYIKSGVKEGIIIQTKGTGATGSFKLAPIKEKKPKTKKPKEGKTDRQPTQKEKKLKEKLQKTEEKSLKSKVKSNEIIYKA